MLMNKIFRRSWQQVIVLSLMGWLLVLPADAGVRVGLKGGVQTSQMTFSSDDLSESNRMGFMVGPTVKFSLPLVGLGVDVSALYDQRELKANDNTFTQKSLSFPINARYGFGLGSLCDFYFAAGPQFSFNVGDNLVDWATDGGYNELSLKSSMLSINVGVGVGIANHLEGSVYYNIPITKTGDFTWKDATNTLQETTSRTNAWYLSVTYFF